MTIGRQDLADILEQYIDAHGIGGVLEVLAEVCGGKAEHLRCNWQDEAGARMWEKSGRQMLKAIVKLPV
jgi:hypothetical protein